jgi:flagellar protein FliO/FliZ
VPTAHVTAAPAPAPAPAPVSARSLTALASVVTGPSTGGSHRAAPAARRTPATRRPDADAGALSGSVLSLQTWRQALAAATGKAS